MRILKLLFSNLNSLKGEYRIAFNEPPLTDSGLFAITGETGAGKTTILDAITLALYNSIARGASEDDIMSYGTAEAFSEVEFETKGKKYRASWSKRRARGKADGAMQSSKWTIADITLSESGVYIAEKKKDVKNEIEKITGGLDKEKFLKSVMLAQGNFAAFLEADKNERGELLEKITGRADYSAISRAAFIRYSHEKKKLELLEARINDENLLSIEQIDELKKLSNQQEITKNSTQKRIKDHEEAIRWLTMLSEKTDKVKLAQVQMMEAEENRQKNANVRELLEQHEKTKPFAEELYRLKSINDNLVKIEAEHIDLKNKIPDLQTEINKKKEEYVLSDAGLKKLKEEYEKSEPEIEKANKLDILISEGIKDLTKEKEELHGLRNTISNRKKELSDNQNDVKIKQTENKTLQTWIDENENSKELESISGNIKARCEEWDKTIAKLEGKNKLYKEQQISIRSEKERHEKLKNDLSEIKQQKKIYESRIKELKRQIHEIYDDKSKKELNAFANKQQLRINNLKDLVNLCNNWHEKNSTFETKKLQKEEKGTLRTRFGKEKSDKEKSVSDIIEKLKLLERNRDLELMVSKYEDDRKKLKEGEPCYLCGSLNHPYATEKPSIDISETDRKIESLRIEKESLTRKISELISKIPSQSQIEEISNEIVKLEASLKNLRSEFNKTISIVKLYELKIEDYEKAEHILLSANEELSVFTIKVQELDNKEESLKKYETDFQSFFDKEAVIDKKIGVNNERLIAQEENVRKIFEEVSKLKEESIGFIEEINTLVKPYSLQISLREELGELLNKIAGLVNLYQDRKSQESENEKLISGLEHKVKEMEKVLKDDEEKELPLRVTRFEKVDKEQKDRVALRKNILNGKNGDEVKREFKKQILDTENKCKELEREFLEKQKELTVMDEKVRGISKQIEENKNERENLHLGIVEKAKGVFSSIEEIQAATLPGDQHSELKSKWETLLKAITESETRYETLQKELLDEKEKKITEHTKEDVEKELHNTQEELLAINKDLEEWALLLRNDMLIREQNKDITAKIEKQQSELDRWSRLNDLIGSANGDKFRRFAQSITLRVLAEQANLHLELLNGRYKVILSERDDAEKLELDIIDTFQADNIRPMNTLSGGESFLVSLALALGLSDMASKNNPVKSLFIDEGFGTLDPETLDTALCALDNLQARGKTIGIISHVEQLKERIPCQIQIIKQSGGFSTIEIIG